MENVPVAEISTANPKTKLKVALVGNPNSGKSTLFNALTGLNQSTGNFPGVTVDKKSGICNIYHPATGKIVRTEIIDLPGTYSLNPKSADEQVAYDVLCDKDNPDYPDTTVIVADASNLKRTLFLVTQIIDLRIPVVLALNMTDLLEAAGMQVDTEKLSSLLGVPVLSISAREKKGIDRLRQIICQRVPAPKKSFFESPSFSDKTQENIERYRKITSILTECVSEKREIPAERLTRRADRILTHRFWGYVVFLAVLFLIFQSIFFLAAYPMDWIETLFLQFSQWGAGWLPPGELSDLFINGILAGLSGIVVFVPQIAFLFLFIAILEDTGYMARVSFIMDKLMRKFGLNGKSVIPLISGVACAVPAIMGTRTISNWKERLITIMITPLMSCSARLPVYTILISLAVPAGKSLGFFNLQGLILMSLYLIGFLAALGAAFVMKYLLKTREVSYFIMELPIYRSPRWSSIGITITDKVKVFLWDAGKVIIAISIVLWFLSSHAPGSRFADIERKYAGYTGADAESKIAAEKLEASYAGILGKSIEPAIAPLGFDWKIGISLVTSFAAREVFVGTMATIYSVGDADNTQSIRKKMNDERHPVSGEKVYSAAVCFSLMIFYAFAMQCMSTLAVVYRETRSWKWPFIQFLYMSALAYLSSLLVYHLLK
ncbi:MAG: ferrous iron transport protein B [Bacteroidota bacterium]